MAFGQVLRMHVVDKNPKCGRLAGDVDDGSKISDQYVWLVWSSAFLVPWLTAYATFPRHRKVMLWACVFTAPFGLTEPLFVPEYWSPHSLFDLARTTGFDIESLIFSFGIGGVGAVQCGPRHRRRLCSINDSTLAVVAPAAASVGQGGCAAVSFPSGSRGA